MELFIDRLQYYMQEKGINNNQMTVSAGLSVGLIGRAIKTKSGLNSDSIEKILYSYPDLNPNWLLTGRGSMLIDSNDYNKNREVNREANRELSAKNIHSPLESNLIDKVLDKVQCTEVKLPNLLDNESPLSIPFYDLPVSAGSLGILDSEADTLTVPTGYVQMEVFRGSEYIFPIIGISMEPLVFSGDWIGVRRIDNLSRSWDFIQTGVIYLIITREDRMIKFIEQTDNSDYIVCSSPNYKPFKVFKGDIISIYRVKAIARGV